MGSMGNDKGNTPVTPNILCKFCDSIKFEALGFHENFGNDGSSNEEFDREQYVDELLGNWRGVEDRALQEILDGEEDCFFCGKVAGCFHEWSHRMFKEEHPNIPKSRVWFEFKIEECNPNGCFICFWVILQVDFQGSAYYRIMQFQKCSEPPLKVEDFCKDFCDGKSLFDWEKSGPEQAFSGRIRPLVMDTRLFCKWKETCDGEHGCISSFTKERPSWLRLIDVKKRCVVVSEDYSSYTALSYVWGKDVQSARLEKSTVDQFQQAGSLVQERLPSLPSTIVDAIEVTRRLGEKYLWVDCLCIVQNDDADKQNFIPQMNLIYGFASVTIVAASGVDAWAGLPGVRKGSRTCIQMPFTIKGMSLLRTLDPERTHSELGIYGTWEYRYLGEAVWCTRGWTFQEKLFTKRALIFTSEQVYWECQKSSWCEDGVWETNNFGTHFRHCFGDESNFQRLWSSDADSFTSWEVYGKLVEEYSRRALTHQSDGLDAFAGIISALELDAGLRFLWGLPTYCLGHALMWGCVYAGKVEPWCGTRRLASCTVRFSDKRIIDCLFPSWTWLGWVGKVHYKTSTLKCKVNLIFYYLDDNGALVQVADERSNDTRTKVTRKDIPESVLAINIASDILFFWSDTVELHVRYGVNRSTPILSRNGEDLRGIIWSQQPTPDLCRSEVAEFVVIGMDVAIIIVLLVDWKDGVAYRRGLATIHKSVWEKLDNRVRKMICLGYFFYPVAAIMGSQNIISTVIKSSWVAFFQHIMDT